MRRIIKVMLNSNWLQLKDAFRNRKIELDISLEDLKIAFDCFNLPQPDYIFNQC